jgi:hypothetical protein
MRRLVYHHKKDSGATYVYEVVEEHWDKQHQQMRSKQVCIGKLDPDTGGVSTYLCKLRSDIYM